MRGKVAQVANSDQFPTATRERFSRGGESTGGAQTYPDADVGMATPQSHSGAPKEGVGKGLCVIYQTPFIGAV